MTVSDCVNYLNYLIKKEKSGGELTTPNINILFQAVNIEMFNMLANEAEMYSKQNKIPFSDVINSFKSLPDFITTPASQLTVRLGSSGIPAGSIVLPSDYSRFIRASIFYKGQQREVEILTGEELSKKLNNLLHRWNEFPGIHIYNNGGVLTANLYPIDSSITSMSLTYLARPPAPVADYYTDNNLNKIYFIAGNGVWLYSGYSYTDPYGNTTVGTGPPVGVYVTSSVAQELAWNVDYHIDFFHRMVVKMGINLSRPDLINVIEQLEAKKI
jgi:hypothetical protein